MKKVRSRGKHGIKQKESKVLYVVYGPTASGKTKLALSLAEKLDGEIVNADSRQIYIGMNIGTAKGNIQKAKEPRKKDSSSRQEKREKEIKSRNSKLEIHNFLIENQVTGWLFDITTPDKPITLAEYQEMAYEVIENILQRGKTPILVGGTGLYIDALVKGYKIPEVEPNLALRKELEVLSVEELRKKLEKLDLGKLNKMNNSDRGNPRRLLRAIEVAVGNSKKEKRNSSQIQNLKIHYLKPGYKFDELEKKINERVEQMFAEGLVEETKNLLKKYGSDIESLKGMGYKEVIEYLNKKISLEEAKMLIKTAHRQYAKRQETWFRKYITEE